MQLPRKPSGRAARTCHQRWKVRGAFVWISTGTDGGTFTISWVEHNGLPVSPPQQCGFGTVVMQQMAKRRVDGAVNLDYVPSGVSWHLTCPAANALEPNFR
jgi:hypothetical protein